MKRTMKRITALVFTIGLIITLVPGMAFGEGFTITGDKNGLEIHVPEKTTDTGYLNPGDKKSSCLKLVNTGSKTITVYIRTNILSEKPLIGGRLANVMTLTIKDGNDIIADGIFRNVADKGNILLGKMAPGEEKTICFFTDLPKEIGNEYQSASFKANWTFTTQSSDDDGGGDKDKDKEKDKDKPKPPVEVDKEPIPEGEPEPPPPVDPETPVVEITDEEIPTGTPDMPKTGEGLPYPFYAIGAFAILAGIGLTLKKK